MEMLEAALKHSLEWSISNRQQQATPVRHELDAEIEQDSHIRAFVTRFKIELNHLMGVKWMLASSVNDTSLSDETNTTASSGDDDSRSGLKENAAKRDRQKPAIKLNGKYSGVYEIGDEADDEVDSELSAAMAKCSITRESASFHEIDDGYRSLSRGSGGATQQTSASARASAKLVKQLNDIRSRVVDLVDEIELCTANARLDEDEIDAYRRRRDALLQKLDLLIEGQVHVEIPKGKHDGQQRATNSSSNDSYEEQVQVIDYDFSRRASDLIEIKSQHNSINCLPLVDSTSVTRVDVCASNTQIVHPIRTGANKIDFGAMMRDYETRKREDEVTAKSTKIHNHLPSSSSTSTYSNNSNSSSGGASTHTNSSSNSSFI